MIGLVVVPSRLVETGWHAIELKSTAGGTVAVVVVAVLVVEDAVLVVVVSVTVVLVVDVAVTVVVVFLATTNSLRHMSK